MKKITSLILVGVVGALIIYDAFVCVKYGTEASISSVVINFAYKMPFFVFLTGIICGHLFWRMRSNKDTKKIDVLS